MLKKHLSISFIFAAFALLLSHQLIPHHHHETDEISAHKHEHEHSDGHNDHDHDFYELFFSLLHHSDVEDHLYINHSNSDRLFKVNFSTLIVPLDCLLKIQKEPSSQYIEHICLFPPEKDFLQSLRFRGPPTA